MASVPQVPVVVAVLAGGALAALGALLLIPLPELGLPLLLAGLRLLGRRYAWARSLNQRVDRSAAVLVARYRRLPALMRGVVILLLAGLGVLLAYVAFQHLT